MIVQKAKLVRADIYQMFAFSIASFMRRVPTRFRPSPLNLFRFPSAFWLVLLLAGQPLCGLWLRVGREVECTVLRVWEQIQPSRYM